METARPKSQNLFNRLPIALAGLVAVMVVLELVLQAADRGLIGGPEAVGWRLELVRNFGFHKAVFDHVRSGGEIEPKVIWPIFTYVFLSRSLVNMLVASTLILGLGKLISERFSSVAVLITFAVCTLTGALAFGLWSKEGGFPLIGGYPVFYGFIGMYTWIKISDLRHEGKNILPAFSTIGMFFAFRSVFSLMYGLPNGWMADLAGLITGFLLAYILAPDGKDRIKRWLQTARSR